MKIQKKQEIEFFGTKTGNANSIALGYATETKNFGEVAVGVMNKSTAAKDPNSPKGVCADSDATLFSVGCGGSGERKNALEVKGDGSVLISGENGNINVADKIKQALDTDASIEIVKSAENDLQYTLMVNNESRGSINIPKDQFLKNVTYDTEAKQLVFTFVTLDEEEHVERISINDLKDVYTAGDGISIDNNVISADFSSVMTAISDEKTQRETTDNEIKSTLDTKADLDKPGYVKVEQLTPAITYDKDNNNIDGMFEYVTLGKLEDIVKNDNPSNGWQYYDFGDMLEDGVVPQYIYDATTNEHIEITATTYLDDITDGNGGDAFNTAKPLDLTHDLYLDNERIGAIGIFKGNKAIVKNSIIIGRGNVTSRYNNKINRCIISETDSYPIHDAEINNSIVFSAGNSSIRTFTDNVILSTRNENISKGECVLIGHCDNAANISNGSILVGQLGDSQQDYCISIGYLCKNHNGIVIGKKSYTGEYSISIGNSNNVGSYPSHCVSIGNGIHVANNCVAIGSNIESTYVNAIVIGYGSKSSGHYSISIGSSIDNKAGNTVIKIGKFANPSATNNYGYYYIGGYKDDSTYYNIEETLTYDNQHKKYIYGIGGYDGTNTAAEGIKSLQEVLADKADASAIPTKVSQLTNDANFITSYTETDPVWTREKTDYYTKTEIDNKGYLTTHQSLDDYATKTDLDDVKASMGDYFDNTLENYVDIRYMNTIVSSKADLVDDKLKAEQLPKLYNITAATTTEEVVTKFNDLLAYLKAKGYMEADTAE